MICTYMTSFLYVWVNLNLIVLCVSVGGVGETVAWQQNEQKIAHTGLKADLGINMIIEITSVYVNIMPILTQNENKLGQ